MCWQGDSRGSDQELRRLRRSIRAHVIDAALVTDDAERVEQIVGELLGNVRRYAPGPFCAELHWTPTTLDVSVHDPGPCFELAGLKQTDRDDWESESGRGVSIITALGGTMATDRSDHGCRVIVTLPVRSREGVVGPASWCPHGHPTTRGEHCPRVRPPREIE